MPLTRHPRARLVTEVRNEIAQWLHSNPKAMELTLAELTAVLSELTYEWALTVVKDEREKV